MQLFLAGEYYKNMGNAIKQIVWGGIVPEVIDANIPCRFRDGRKPLERRQDKNSDRGGTGDLNADISCKSPHDTEIQKWSTFGDYPIRGGYA